jgi:hypothetical protein
MQHFYDGQIRRYITQFIRAISGVSYADGAGNLHEVPVRFGNTNKQVASILRQNSENFLAQAPFIAVYVQSLELSRARMQDPTFVSKINIRERDVDENGNWTATKGPDVTVERLMPNPYQLTLKADIWTSNIDQKLQILEQLVVLFNPAIDLQTTSNYVDWTSLTTLELTNIEYTNQVVPTGDQELEIASLTFMTPIWLSPPVKVKRMGVITSIIARVFDEDGNYSNDVLAGSLISRQAVTIDGYGVLVTNSSLDPGAPDYVAQLLNYVEGVQTTFNSRSTKQGTNINWRMVLEKYPGKFTAGLSKLTFVKPDGTTSEARIRLDTSDETLMHLTFNEQTLPANSVIDGRTYVDAIIDPTVPLKSEIVSGVRFLILQDINPADRTYDSEQDNDYDAGVIAPGVKEWGSFSANANDIIKWNGTHWERIFNSQATTALTYITNIYTGVQYKWDGQNWTKSMEGTYPAGNWRIIL